MGAVTNGYWEWVKITEVTNAINTISTRVFGKEPNKMVYELASFWTTNIGGSSLLRRYDMRAI
jgi:hypothetical protein